jgi:hypothetical protein
VIPAVGEDSSRPAPTGSAIRQLLKRDGWAMLAGAVATIALELGVYGLARRSGAGPLACLVSFLGVTTVWVAIAGPAMATGGRTLWGVLLRGAVPADASGVSLLILCATSPLVTLAGAVKAYCVLAGMALLGMAAVACAASRTGRYAWAVVVVVMLALAVSTPFWTGGLLAAHSGDQARPVVTGSVYVNPFYGVTAAFVDSPESRFVWHQWNAGPGLVYDLSALRDKGPPPVLWYPPAIVLVGLAGLWAAAGLALRRLRRVSLVRRA